MYKDYFACHLTWVVCAGESEEAESSKEQQSCDVQEVQSGGAARYTDKIL